MGLVSDLVDRLLADPLVEPRRVAGVWLFGSFARGEARAESDVDLAILCEAPLDLDRLVLMDRLARAAGRDVDLIDLARAPPALAWEVVTTGRLLAEPDEEAVEDFVRRARWAAEDDEQRSRMILAAQVAHGGGALP